MARVLARVDRQWRSGGRGVGGGGAEETEIESSKEIIRSVAH